MVGLSQHGVSSSSSGVMGDHHFHFQVTKVCVLHCLVLRVFLLFVIVLLPDVFQQGVRPGTSLRVDLQYVVFVYCCLSVALLLPCGGAQAASSPLAGQTWKRSTSLRILVSVILLLGRIPTVLKIAVTLFPMVSRVKAKPLSLTNKWSFILVGELRPDVFHKDGHPPVQRLVRDNFCRTLVVRCHVLDYKQRPRLGQNTAQAHSPRTWVLTRLEEGMLSAESLNSLRNPFLKYSRPPCLTSRFSTPSLPASKSRKTSYPSV